MALEGGEHVVEVGHGFVVDGRDDVALDDAVGTAGEGAQAGFLGRAAGGHGHQGHALGQLEQAGHALGPAGDADGRALEAAVADQPGHDAVDLVHGDGKADAGAGARRRVDGGVDPDQPAGRIQQRAAGVARVDGRVGLDRAADVAAGDRLDLAVERADQAGGERLVQPEGVADGIDLLAHLQLLAAAQRNRRQLGFGGVDLQDCQVPVGEGTDQLRLEAALVGQGHPRGIGALDHMEVGDDVAAVVPDETGAGARGTCCTLSEKKSRSRPRVVILTTAGELALKTAMLFNSSASRAPRGATGRGA